MQNGANRVNPSTPCTVRNAICPSGARHSAFFLIFGSMGQSISALGATASKHLAAISGGHSLTEAMLLGALKLLGLIGTEHLGHLLHQIISKRRHAAAVCLKHPYTGRIPGYYTPEKHSLSTYFSNFYRPIGGCGDHLFPPQYLVAQPPPVLSVSFSEKLCRLQKTTFYNLRQQIRFSGSFAVGRVPPWRLPLRRLKRTY